MRISELSKLSGIPIATLKFYLREGLLPPGIPVGRNQAEYSDRHLRRILFIRAMTNVGRLDLSSVRQLLQVIEADQRSLTEVYDVVDRTVWPMDPEPPDTPLTKQADADATELMGRLGWAIDPRSPGYSRFVTVLVTLRKLGCDCGIDYFTTYAEAALSLMAQELDLLPEEGRSPDRAAAVARTILLGIAMTSMSSMAQAQLLAQSEARAPSVDACGHRLDPVDEVGLQPHGGSGEVKPVEMRPEHGQ